MPNNLNHPARDSMVHQITDAMDDLNQKKRDLEVALSYMEQARNSSYTESMDEVKVVLHIVSKRLEMNVDKDRTKVMNLAGVADQIHQGEKNV